MNAEHNPLGLLYDFEPNTISVTKDTGDPVANTITFSIANPNGNPLVNFKNTDKVTAKDKLPGKGEDSLAPHLSRFYIWFPWGGNTQDLATSQEGANITCSLGENSSSWIVNPMSSETIGTYWILFPEEDTVLNTQESVSFTLSNIISTAKIGMTYMYISYANIPGFGNGYITPEPTLNKIPPPLTIVSFSADKNCVNSGEDITLNWATRSADYCTLSPPLDASEPDKQYPANESQGLTFAPKKTDVYTLTAYSKGGEYIFSKPLDITVKTLGILTFQAQPQTVGIHGVTRLSWETQNAVKCVLNPGNISVKPNGYHYCVLTENTDYTLTVSDSQNHQVQKPMSVNVNTAIIPNQKTSTNSVAPSGPPGCDGYPGSDGNNGQGGAPGCDGYTAEPVQVTSPDGMSVLIQGGKGGNGGDGGNGGNNAIGGAGGDGGLGGNGSVVQLQLPPLTTESDCDIVYEIIYRGGDGGNGGKGGTGSKGDGANGNGGKGGKAGDISIIFDPSFTGTRGHYIITNLPGKGGDPGGPGGQKGSQGEPGSVNITETGTD